MRVLERAGSGPKSVLAVANVMLVPVRVGAPNGLMSSNPDDVSVNVNVSGPKKTPGAEHLLYLSFAS